MNEDRWDTRKGERKEWKKHERGELRERLERMMHMQKECVRRGGYHGVIEALAHQDKGSDGRKEGRKEGGREEGRMLPD